jgi:hypothetical protein
MPRISKRPASNTRPRRPVSTVQASCDADFMTTIFYWGHAPAWPSSHATATSASTTSATIKTRPHHPRKRSEQGTAELSPGSRPKCAMLLSLCTSREWQSIRMTTTFVTLEDVLLSSRRGRSTEKVKKTWEQERWTYVKERPQSLSDFGDARPSTYGGYHGSIR